MSPDSATRRLERVLRAPEMFAMRRSYESGVAFLMGYDSASGLSTLDGFSAWLRSELHLPSSHAHLAWPALIARHACPERWDDGNRSAEDDSNTFNEMFRLAIAFLGEPRPVGAAPAPQER